MSDKTSYFSLGEISDSFEVAGVQITGFATKKSTYRAFWTAADGRYYSVSADTKDDAAAFIALWLAADETAK